MSRRQERRNKKLAKSNQNAKSCMKGWGEAILFALIAALVIRALIVTPYRIPTPSMEQTLLTGDFLLTSKLHYGPRTPQSVGLPIVGWHIPGLRLPSTRLPGFSSIKRNDIVVFNYPIDEGIPAHKTNYVKRLVGMPADTLRIDDKVLFVNHEEAQNFSTFQNLYSLIPRNGLRISLDRLRDAGAVPYRHRTGFSPSERVLVFMTDKVRDEIEQWTDIQSVEVLLRSPEEDFNSRSPFRFAQGLGAGNPDQMPEIVIPYKGQVIDLTPENLNVYWDIITRYEGNRLELRNNRIFINGLERSEYTIQQHYYFMMGDNRDDSEDSRSWGFVPDDHIVGRVWITYFSIDSWMPRFNRIFRTVHRD
jgi:signal peptidase I